MTSSYGEIVERLEKATQALPRKRPRHRWRWHIAEGAAMTSMVAGDVARMAAWKVHGVTPAAIYTLSFKAPKDRVGVFLLLGDEAKDGTESLDVEKRLNELGWFRQPHTKDTVND